MKTYIDAITPGCVFALKSRPSIQLNHVDGPLLVFSDGQLHWLTFRERGLLWLGLTNAEKLQQERRPKLTAWLAAYKSKEAA
jgi:hypothetical protein